MAANVLICCFKNVNQLFVNKLYFLFCYQLRQVIKYNEWRFYINSTPTHFCRTASNKELEQDMLRDVLAISTENITSAHKTTPPEYKTEPAA